MALTFHCSQLTASKDPQLSDKETMKQCSTYGQNSLKPDMSIVRLGHISSETHTAQWEVLYDQPYKKYRLTFLGIKKKPLVIFKPSMLYVNLSLFWK